MITRPETNFARRLVKLGEEDPSAIALVLQMAGAEDQALTRAELLEGAAGWTATYARVGLIPGTVVVLILPHSPDLLFAYWGAVLAGLVPSIMPYLTEKLQPERYRADLAALAAVTQPAAVVTYPELEEVVHPALAGTTCAVLLTGEIHPTAFDPAAPSLAGLNAAPDDIVLLQHSSGTTGLQKGVALSHRAVFTQIEHYAEAIRLREDDCIVSWLPLYHDMGLIACFLLPLLTGIQLVMMSPFTWVRRPVRLLEAVHRYRGTLTWLPNFAFNFCAAKIRDREMEGIDLSSWRAVINCSEPTRLSSHQAFADRFAAWGLHPQVLAVSYAMAENTFAVTQTPLGSEERVDRISRSALQEQKVAKPAAEGEDTLQMLSAGLPIRGTRVRVLDEAGKELPERAAGELAIQSDCMLSGYYNRPDATRAAFLEGWYLTGDIGYMAGGEVFVVGRRKDLIIVGGKNIYPQDLEHLAQQVEGVHAGRTVAFGVFDEEAGTEDVVLLVEVESLDHRDHPALIESVRRAITRGSAVTLADVRVVPRGWLIKTSSGKTARAANRDRYLAELRDG